jgi:outer membrane lipoprotein-sorting protein
MINELALLIALQVPGTTPAQPESALVLLGRMFNHYASAKTLASKIRMTQTAMNKTVVFESELSYERPSKIFFVQKKGGDRSYSPHLVSDGQMFEYSAPDNVDNKRIKDFKETVHPKQGDIAIAEMWPEIVPSIEKGDDGFALEAMIARTATLRTIRGQLVSFVNKGRMPFGNKIVNDIEGRWKAAGFGEEGEFSMYLTDDGDIVRHQTKLRYAVGATWLIQHKLPANSFPDGIEVVTTWDVDTVINQPASESLFKLPS